MTSRVATVFDALARQLEVEVDYKLVLDEWGVKSADGFCFQVAVGREARDVPRGAELFNACVQAGGQQRDGRREGSRRADPTS
eukprot:5343079-Heterocapsa_arctica.AAC.1